MKRLLDIVLAGAGLIATSPILLGSMLAIWLTDFRSPFYVADRVGRRGSPFRLVKLRSMVVDADKTGVSSTAATDPRITRVGSFVRRYKLDELPQLWNVLMGSMSMVGPRPQVQYGVDRYTAAERRLLEVRPGITDLASIVFADEGDILHGHPDPDRGYDELIRPWKSRLGLLYVERRNLRLDVELIGLTALALISRERALAGLQRILERLGADPALLEVAARKAPLQPAHPPGSEV